jgi:hypothetical protein
MGAWGLVESFGETRGEGCKLETNVSVEIGSEKFLTTERRESVGRGAGEAGSVVGIAGAFVFCVLRVGAKGARHFRALSGIVREFCGDDGVGRDAFFDPLLEREPDVLLRIGSRDRRARLPDGVRAGTASTMLHAGHHVEADEGR